MQGNSEASDGSIDACNIERKPICKTSLSSSDSVQASQRQPIRKAALPSNDSGNALQLDPIKLDPFKLAPVKLPIPGFRNAAGGVTRRVDRVIRADPPPTNTSSASSVFKKQKPGRSRKLGNGPGGNNSDSDSEGEERKPKRDDVDTIAANPRHRELPPSPDSSITNDADLQLRKEEEARIQQFRVLRELEQTWFSIQQRRAHYWRHRGDKIDRLTTFRGYYNCAGLEISKGVLTRNAHLNEYLEEVLYGVIKEDTDEDVPSRMASLQEIVERVETGLFNRVSQFETWKYNKLHLHERIVRAFEEAQKQLWRSSDLRSWVLDEAVRSTATFWEGVRGIIQTFMLQGSFLPRGDDTFIDHLVNTCWDKLLYNMSESIPAEVSVSQLEEVPDITWLQPFEKSRHDKKPTVAYLEWLVGDMTPSRLDIMFRELYCLKRREAVREYQSCMETVRMSVRQEFCCDVVRAGVVSLVLTKGNYLTAVREISQSRLESLGWFRESEGAEYWKCEPFNTHKYGVGLFKVNMDGKVLGMFCRNKSWCPVLLEYGEDSEITLRPLDSVEKTAVDLP